MRCSSFTPWLLLLLAPLAQACGRAEVTPRTPEVLAETAFEALRSNDYGRLSEVMLRAEDLRWLSRTRKDDQPEERKAREASLEGKGAGKLAADASEKGEQQFVRTREESAKAVDWAKAEFGKILEEPSRSRVDHGIEGATIYFTVKSGDREETFGLGDCLKTPDGWRVGGGIRWIPNPHRGKTTPEQLMTEKTMDDIASAVTRFQAAAGRLPATFAELAGAEGPDKGSLAAPKDAWGTPFVWRVRGSTRWELRSAGPDAKLDTADDLVLTEAGRKGGG